MLVMMAAVAPKENRVRFLIEADNLSMIPSYKYA